MAFFVYFFYIFFCEPWDALLVSNTVAHEFFIRDLGVLLARLLGHASGSIPPPCAAPQGALLSTPSPGAEVSDGIL